MGLNQTLSMETVLRQLLAANREMVVMMRRFDNAARKKAESRLSLADRNVLEDLLPVLHAHAGADGVWTIADLLEDAKEIPELARAIEKAGLDESTARRFGKLLARADGVEIGDLQLERGAHVREGWLWMTTALKD